MLYAFIPKILQNSANECHNAAGKQDLKDYVEGKVKIMHT